MVAGSSSCCYTSMGSWLVAYKFQVVASRLRVCSSLPHLNNNFLVALRPSHQLFRVDEFRNQLHSFRKNLHSNEKLPSNQHAASHKITSSLVAMLVAKSKYLASLVGILIECNHLADRRTRINAYQKR